ncbi:MAG: AAA family ATPase [Bacteroidota bacterium]
MIKRITIKNYKSVADLSLDLGRFNILIGENGCGKSNILEAIALGSASNADKLDYEFLGSRGIRATQSEFMFSAFENGKKNKSIGIEFTDNKNETFPVTLKIDADSSQKWININKEIANKEIDNYVKALINKDSQELEEKATSEKELNWISTMKSVFNELSKDDELKVLTSTIFTTLNDKLFKNKFIGDFIIFSPEQSSLRDFREPSQILPLGIRGEGLFQELKRMMYNKKSNKQLIEIKELLSLLDWFEDFQIPGDLLSNEFTLQVKDKYLHKNLQYFDQRSTNEGFLFLLFYFTLFISKDTPPFFAIDNIEAAFNPKLCTRLIRTLAFQTSKKKKQVIVTTHNPAVLDGLNLKDDDQRLFIISRNMEGHTKLRRIEYNPDRTLALSEAWNKGLIGGLPDNF